LEAVALGRRAFIARVKRELGVAVRHRELDEVDGMYRLH